MTTQAIKGIAVNGHRTQLIVDNLKCGGCAKTIFNALSEIGYKSVSVNPELSTVEFDNPAETLGIHSAVDKLRSLGYPLVESEEGLKAAALRARSYLSCALGKLGR